MKNIKTLALLKDGFGLEAGALFIRNNNEEPFVCKQEVIGDTYAFTSTVTLGESAITKEMFKATGWFEKRLTKAEKKAIKQAEKVSELDNLRKSAEKLTLIESRINTKRDEYREKYVSLLKKVDNELLAGETLQNMEEAITVYHNLIDLLNKLTA